MHHAIGTRQSDAETKTEPEHGNEQDTTNPALLAQAQTTQRRATGGCGLANASPTKASSRTTTAKEKGLDGQAFGFAPD